MQDTKILPRRDLREPAFRKYEPYIARGCLESYSFNPQTDPIKVAPTTFVARFRDAILAKIRFNYPSSLIPPTSDISKLEAQELSDGRVLIKNKTESALIIEENKSITEQDVTSIMHTIASKQRPSFELSVSGGEELGKVLNWAAQHSEIDCVVIAQNGKAFFYNL